MRNRKTNPVGVSNNIFLPKLHLVLDVSVYCSMCSKFILINRNPYSFIYPYIYIYILAHKHELYEYTSNTTLFLYEVHVCAPIAKLITII